MDLKKKTLYSVIPLSTIALMVLHFVLIEGVISMYSFMFVNIMLIIQTVLLYSEMEKANLTSARKALYTLILVSFYCVTEVFYYSG